MAVRIDKLAEPIPGYRLLERLGGGGFGEVWKCEAPGGLHKAIKFVFGDLGAAGDDGQRAEQELKALSRVKTVRHPYILSLERYDIIDGQLMIVMELADCNLWDRFKECRNQGLPGIPREELLRYMEETAEALDLMNEQYQLQHLDIKPQNIFLIYQHIKVADFGLVKDLEGMKASVTGGVTPVYAAPETFDGWVSRYCDQYSLAIVYQELLTGVRPFTGNNIRQLVLQHLQAAPNLSALPPADQPAIARALSKTPGDRFPTCRALVEVLRGGEDRREAGPSGGIVIAVDDRPGAPETGPTLDAVIPSRMGGLGTIAGSLTENKGDADNSISDGQMETPNLRVPHSPDLHPGTTHCIRAIEEPILQPDSGIERTAPPEVQGDGALFPALVIGLGQLGTTIVQCLRKQLHTRFGGMDRLPHLRLMVLDTDPEVVRAATRGSAGERLSETDVLLAPLNRPSHYLRPRDGRPEIESWLNPRMLYRIPRSQVTTGVRALGRLAFCDNYRVIVRRLQTELEACGNPDALAAAGEQTTLGVRSNRIRIYILTSLAGGSGSGMFLDLAYTVRALLKQAGYTRPDVTGLLLLPGVDRNRTRTLTLGNACASLRELIHFARPESTFTAKYHQREAPIQDGDSPFGRTILLPLPEETDERATRELVELAGLFLARDLCSPLGRAADMGRSTLTELSRDARGSVYQTFGLYPLCWPRQALLRNVARRLCQNLVRRWMSKDSKPIREAVHAWVQEQWTREELGSSVLMERLGEVSRQALGQDPEEIFRTAAGPLLERLSACKGRKTVEEEIPPQEIIQVLEEFETLLGKAQEDGLSDEPARLAVIMQEAANKLVQQWGQKLAEMPVRLIEAPEFRLAGAEEVVRQMVASIEQALRHHEPLAKDLCARAAEAFERLKSWCVPASKSGVRRRGRTSAELMELLHDYPKWMYQTLLVRQVGNIFLTLRGHLADEMREINFCRVRLGELLRMLEEPADAAESSPPHSTLGKHLFPAGCKDFSQAVEHIEGRLGPESLNDLDTRMEAMLRKQFTALVNICLTSANVLKNVETAMLQTAEAFVAEQLGNLDVAEMFLQQCGDDQQAMDEIACFFDESAPELPSSNRGGGGELCVLSVPAGASGDRFRTLAGQAAPDVEWHAAAGDDDIVIYRERLNLPLADLPQLGPLGQDAYKQMSAAENFTPHCRCDIQFGEV